MIEQKHIDAVSGPLKSVLDNELQRGNVIRETWRNWPLGFTSISLKYEFISPIQRDLPSVKYIEVNDRHYWKAEYHDEANHIILICGFDKR